MAAAITVSAAETPKTSTDTAKSIKAESSWINSVSVAPVGAIKTQNIDSKSQWGAGVDLSYAVNPYVSIHVLNLGFEGYGQSTEPVTKDGKHTGDTITTGEEPWHGPAVDETDVLVKANISTFSTEKFKPYFIGGGLYDWNLNSFGFSAGLGVELYFNRSFSIAGDYSLRAMFKDDAYGSSKNSLGTLKLVYTF